MNLLLLLSAFKKEFKWKYVWIITMIIREMDILDFKSERDLSSTAKWRLREDMIVVYKYIIWKKKVWEKLCKLKHSFGTATKGQILHVSKSGLT